MITAARAKVIRAQAVVAAQHRIVNERAEVKLPEVAPENPTKWVILKDATVCPAGSVSRVLRGTIVDDISTMRLLAREGVELAAVE